MSDEDWYNANLVYIPYCSSDAHMGDSDHEVKPAVVLIELGRNPGSWIRSFKAWIRSWAQEITGSRHKIQNTASV